MYFTTSSGFASAKARTRRDLPSFVFAYFTMSSSRLVFTALRKSFPTLDVLALVKVFTAFLLPFSTFATYFCVVCSAISSAAPMDKARLVPVKRPIPPEATVESPPAKATLVISISSFMPVCTRVSSCAATVPAAIGTSMAAAFAALWVPYFNACLIPILTP